MGAWTFVRPRLEALLAPRSLTLRYVGRPERASPSEGTPARHAAEQARIAGRRPFADASGSRESQQHRQLEIDASLEVQMA